MIVSAALHAALPIFMQATEIPPFNPPVWISKLLKLLDWLVSDGF